MYEGDNSKTTDFGTATLVRPESPRFSWDKELAAKIKEEYVEDIEIQPEESFRPLRKGPQDQLRRHLPTMYEGNVLYLRFWNFWVRPGFNSHDRDDIFYHDYEHDSGQTRDLVSAVVGHWPPGNLDDEREVWDRIARIWKWLGANVDYNGTEFGELTSADRWPSIAEYARYYAGHGRLVWAACFSKAHLFATLLGRCLGERWRFGIASAHHTEGGAPPTASHVFVGAYIAGRWYYLDPTWVQAVPDLPSFDARDSVGLFDRVDYEHPFSFKPLPTSPLVYIPLLRDH